MGVDIIDDDFMVCTDCLIIIVNDDASGLDYSMSEEDAAERERVIREAMAKIQCEESQIVVGESDRDDNFSACPCACCGTRLAGQRHHFVILSSGREG